MSTLSELLVMYESYRDIKPGTFEQYSWVIASFEKHLGRVGRTEDLTSEQINDWLRELRKSHSPYTCRSRRMTILSIWSFAAQMNLSAPLGPVRIVKAPDMIVRTLTKEKLLEALVEAQNLRGKYHGILCRDLVSTWMRATLETALRPSDMIPLTYPDVRNGTFYVIQEKTGRRRRASFTEHTLENFSAVQKEGRLWPVPRPWIGKQLRKVGDKIGVPHLTHTMLRKTAITDVESQCPGVGWIFAGHSSPSTTRSWYTDQDRAYSDIPKPRFE